MSFTRVWSNANPKINDMTQDVDVVLQQFRVDVAERLAAAMPIGIIMPNPVSTVPDGFMQCDGRSLARADYPTLFSVIGTTYGLGDDNPNTFNIPDYRGYFLRGRDTRGVASLVIGTVKSRVAHGAFNYMIAGLKYSKAANTVGFVLSGTTIPNGDWGVFGFQIDSDGVISIVEGADNSDGYANQASAFYSCPDADEGKKMIGCLTVSRAASGGFVPGTTLLDDANTTYNMWNFALGADPGCYNQILSELTSGSPTVPFARSATVGHRSFWRDIRVGSAISGTGIPSSTTIIAIDADNITMSQNASATGSSKITITDSIGLVQLSSFLAHRHQYPVGGKYVYNSFQTYAGRWDVSSSYGGNETRPINIGADMIIRVDTI